MTWGGAQGFQAPIESENFIVKNFGVYGNTHTERKLTCTLLFRYMEYPLVLIAAFSDVEFYLSGHMTPRTCALTLH